MEIIEDGRGDGLPQAVRIHKANRFQGETSPVISRLDPAHLASRLQQRRLIAKVSFVVSRDDLSTKKASIK